jgi:hypothetical protein
VGSDVDEFASIVSFPDKLTSFSFVTVSLVTRNNALIYSWFDYAYVYGRLPEMQATRLREIMYLQQANFYVTHHCWIDPGNMRADGENCKFAMIIL